MRWVCTDTRQSGRSPPPHDVTTGAEPPTTNGISAGDNPWRSGGNEIGGRLKLAIVAIAIASVLVSAAAAKDRGRPLRERRPRRAGLAASCLIQRRMWPPSATSSAPIRSSAHSGSRSAASPARSSRSARPSTAPRRRDRAAAGRSLHDQGFLSGPRAVERPALLPLQQRPGASSSSTAPAASASMRSATIRRARRRGAIATATIRAQRS